MGHRHKYRLLRAHHHPKGYLFICHRCVALGLYGLRFVRKDKFWAGVR